MLKIGALILILSKISTGYHCYGGIATIKTATIGDAIECAFFFISGDAPATLIASPSPVILSTISLDWQTRLKKPTSKSSELQNKFRILCSAGQPFREIYFFPESVPAFLESKLRHQRI